MQGVVVVGRALVWLAVAGILLPQPLLASGMPAGQPPAVVDVTLREGGVLVGQVVDTQGSALAGLPVSVWDRDRQVAQTSTDGGGYFSVTGLRGGVYRVMAAGRTGLYRLWSASTAPPLCRPAALLVAPGQTVRGRDCLGYCGVGNLGLPRGGALCFWLSDPCVLASLAAVGAAVPIYICTHDHPPASP